MEVRDTDLLLLVRNYFYTCEVLLQNLTREMHLELLLALERVQGSVVKSQPQVERLVLIYTFESSYNFLLDSSASDRVDLSEALVLVAERSVASDDLLEKPAAGEVLFLNADLKVGHALFQLDDDVLLAVVRSQARLVLQELFTACHVGAIMRCRPPIGFL